jgi:competence protein ComEC
MHKLGVVLFAACIMLGCLPSMPDASGGDGPATSQGGTCGSGSWQPGWLEIHHIDAGEAVSTLVVSPVGRSMLIDVGEADWNRDSGAKLVGDYVRRVLGCARLDYVVISHFHVDHVGFPGHGGLWHLAVQQGFAVGKLVHRDLYHFVGERSGTLAAWSEYLQSAEGARLSPEVATLGQGQAELGGDVVVALVGVDGNGLLPPGDLSSDPAPPNENDYSIAALLRFGRLDYFTAGDLSGRSVAFAQWGYSYHDGETSIARRVKDVDVYRANHHGSNYASNETLLAQIDPEVTIVQVGDDNQNGHPAQPTVDRLVATSAVYFTERGSSGTDLRNGKVAGDVVLRTANGVDYTVNGDAFVASDPERVDADGDGYFAEADPDDHAATVVPAPKGDCDDRYQACP